MNYCGSGSGVRKVLVPAQAPDNIQQLLYNLVLLLLSSSSIAAIKVDILAAGVSSSGGTSSMLPSLG